MNTNAYPLRHGRARPPMARRQRGVVLIVSLLLLVVMLISAAALMRSTDLSLFQAGNIAFKRDLTHQAEKASKEILDAFVNGALSDQIKQANTTVGLNYSAMRLPTGSRGIPDALLVDDVTFASIGTTSKDIELPDQKVTIRYVIDRMCTEAGLDTVLGPDKCTLADNNNVRGGSARKWQRAEIGSVGGAGANPQSVVFRLSIRVTGPRNTQAFYQTTFTAPTKS
jgi:type IV pilus assembly protein PilX